jgi:hypothetical protein
MNTTRRSILQAVLAVRGAFLACCMTVVAAAALALAVAYATVATRFFQNGPGRTLFARYATDS